MPTPEALHPDAHSCFKGEADRTSDKRSGALLPQAFFQAEIFANRRVGALCIDLTLEVFSSAATSIREPL
jgi:hypothetical protein